MWRSLFANASSAAMGKCEHASSSCRIAFHLKPPVWIEGFGVREDIAVDSIDRICYTKIPSEASPMGGSFVLYLLATKNLP